MFRSRLVPYFVSDTKEKIEEFERKISNFDIRLSDFKDWQRNGDNFEDIARRVQSRFFDILWTVDTTLAFATYGKITVEHYCKAFICKYFMDNYEAFKAALTEQQQACA